MQKLSPIGWALRPLKRYAKFSGRAPRAEFWWFFLFAMLLYFAVLLLLGATGAALAPLNVSSGAMDGAAAAVLIFVAVFWLGLFIPTLAVQVRRLHDINRSGWWLVGFWLLYLLYIGVAMGLVLPGSEGGTPPDAGAVAAVGILALIFFVYSIVLLVFFCLRGTEGPNRYGEDPYAPDVANVFA